MSAWLAAAIVLAAFAYAALRHYKAQTEDEPPETVEIIDGVGIELDEYPEWESRMAESEVHPDDVGHDWDEALPIYSQVGEQRYGEANNATHHRVYLPGPHGAGYAYVIDHPPTCSARPCNTAAQITWNEQHGIAYPVQGEYFTVNGVHYERCSWQPGARRHPWEDPTLRVMASEYAIAEGARQARTPQLPQGRCTDCPPRTWRSRALDILAAPQNWIYR